MTNEKNSLVVIQGEDFEHTFFYSDSDGNPKALGLNIGGGDSIQVTYPGTSSNVTLDTSSVVSIVNDDRGEFLVSGTDTNSGNMATGGQQTVTIRITRGTDQEIYNLEDILKVQAPALTV